MATLKLCFGIGVLAAIILLAIRVIPPFFSNYQFEDSIKTEALQSTYTTRTEDAIRDSVIKHARDYDIELTPEQVHVSRTGGFGSGSLIIEADYTVPLDLPGYSTTLNFHASSKNRGVF